MKSNVAAKGHSLRHLVGLPAPLAYRELLLKWIDADGIDLFTYETPPHMQARIAMGESERKIVDQANRMRRGTGVPFWEAVFATCSVEGQCTEAIVAAALFHNGQGVKRHLSRNEVDEGALERAARDSNAVVALGSKVTARDGSAGQLNFLDFHCPVSEQSRTLVSCVCRRLMPGGFVVLDSGGSYHACSANMVSDEERIHTLAKALLVSPLVDARHAAHQLLQESSSLRISHGGSIGKVPVVVDVWPKCL